MSGPQDNWQAANDFANDKLTRFAHVQKMLRSHVSGCFWLGGVSPLSPHLLQGKNQVAFEYQGQHWPVVFMQDKSGFSGGWRQCAIDNELVEGDVVVYEIVSPDRLKLYFFRTTDWEGSRAQRPSFESMQYADAPAINWNGRKPISMVEGRKEYGTPSGSAGGGGSRSAAAPKSQKSKASGSLVEPPRGTPANAATPGSVRGASPATAPSPRIRIKLHSAKCHTPSTTPSSPLRPKNQKHGNAMAMEQNEGLAKHGAAGPSSPPASKRQKRGSAVAPESDDVGRASGRKKEQAAGQQQRQGTRATRGGGARAALAEAEGSGSGRPSKSKSLMDLVHSSPTVQLECEDGGWGGSSGVESEGGDGERAVDQAVGMSQERSKGGGLLGTRRRIQQEKSKKGGDDGDGEGLQKKGSREGGTGLLRGSSKGREEAGESRELSEGLQKRGKRDRGTDVLSGNSKGREEAGGSGGVREWRRRQRDRGGGVRDEEQVTLAQDENGDGSSRKTAKRQVQGSGRAGSAAGKAKKSAYPQPLERGGGVSGVGVHKRSVQPSPREQDIGASRAAVSKSAQPEPNAQGGVANRAGVHKQLAAGKGSKVLDMQAVGGAGVEGALQNKSVMPKRTRLQQEQVGQSPKPVTTKGPQPRQGLPKVKDSVGSRAAACMTSPAGSKAQATKPRKLAGAQMEGEKGSGSGVGVKHKGSSSGELRGDEPTEKDTRGQTGEGDPPIKKQALQSRANQSKEAGLEVASFPQRRCANAQPIEGKQMGLAGEEALQGFWNIAEPEYDCEGLLQEIKDVAKAEVRPVVVDETTGNCIHAPNTLTISGSLGSGWIHDPQTGYFPVRFVNREGYYMRLEDGT